MCVDATGRHLIVCFCNMLISNNTNLSLLVVKYRYVFLRLCSLCILPTFKSKNNKLFSHQTGFSASEKRIISLCLCIPSTIHRDAHYLDM